MLWQRELMRGSPRGVWGGAYGGAGLVFAYDLPRYRHHQPASKPAWPLCWFFGDAGSINREECVPTAMTEPQQGPLCRASARGPSRGRCGCGASVFPHVTRSTPQKCRAPNASELAERTAAALASHPCAEAREAVLVRRRLAPPPPPPRPLWLHLSRARS